MQSFNSRIFDQFEKYHLFRRIVVFFACALTLYTTAKSFEYAFYSQLSGADVAMVIAAIQVPVAGIMSFVSKLYWSSRDGQ